MSESQEGLARKDQWSIMSLLNNSSHFYKGTPYSLVYGVKVVIPLKKEILSLTIIVHGDFLKDKSGSWSWFDVEWVLFVLKIAHYRTIVQQKMIILPQKYAYKYLQLYNVRTLFKGLVERKFYNPFSSVEAFLSSPLLRSTSEWELKERLEREAHKTFPQLLKEPRNA